MFEFSVPVQPAGTYFGPLGNIPSDWLAEQKRLVVLMKDGYTFFKANEGVFAQRFAAPGKDTFILLNHPDTPFIDAITDKDYHKTPESQRNDIMQSILLLQNIAAQTKTDGEAGKFYFGGVNDVLTQNIFLGDGTGFVKYYPSESYRGDLEGCMFDATKSPEARELFDRASQTCTALLMGRTVIVTVKNGDQEQEAEKILPPSRELLTYQVPEDYRKNNLRL